MKVSHEERNGSRGRGRSTFRGRGRGRGRAFKKSLIECFKCHKLDHFQCECPDWKEAYYAELDEHEELLLMSYVKMNNAKRDDDWFLDSVCSNHMCGGRNLLYELDEKFKHVVKLGNNT